MSLNVDCCTAGIEFCEMRTSMKAPVFKSTLLVALAVFLLSAPPVLCSSIFGGEQRSEEDMSQVEILNKHSKTLVRILDTLTQQEDQIQGLTQAVNVLSQEMQDAMMTMTQQLAYVNHLSQVVQDVLTEQRNILTNIPEKVVEALGGAREADDTKQVEALGGAREANDTNQDCLWKEEVLAHGEIVVNGCDLVKCEMGFTYALGRRESVLHGFQTVSDGCYLPVLRRKTWDQAKDYCSKLGGFLAKPPYGMREFRQFLYGKSDGLVLWLGARKADDGTFRYHSDNSTVNPLYGPRPDYPRGDCVRIDPTSSSLNLYAAECDGRPHFVCQIL